MHIDITRQKQSFNSMPFHNFILFGILLACGLLAYALFTQHVQGLEPCVRCIYQRCALLIIIAFGLVGLHKRLQILAFLGSFVGSILGIYQAYKQVGVIKGTIIDTCAFRPDFGVLGSLDDSLPWLLSAGGDCADTSWQVLSLTMAEWMLVIFSAYAIVSLLFIYLWIQKKLTRKSI